jgi:hypothetical protein
MRAFFVPTLGKYFSQPGEKVFPRLGKINPPKSLALSPKVRIFANEIEKVIV